MDPTSVTVKLRLDEGSLLPVEVDLLVDPDAPVTIVPGRVLRDVGVVPAGDQTVELGGGQKGARKVGQAYCQLLDREARTKVAFGEEGDRPRLGYETVEACGLVIDPETRVVKAPR